MSKKKILRPSSVLSAIMLSLLTIIILAGVVLFIKFKSDSTANTPADDVASPVLVSISEDPVVTPEVVYTNEAATYKAPDKAVASMLCYNADGSLRNEYKYDEYGRLMYFYSHSSTSETEITYADGYEILSTYTNTKHFGDEYYDLNHNLILFNNLKNGYSYSYEYDSNGKVLSESYLTNTGASRNTVYTYDSTGNLSTVTCTLNDVLNSRVSYSYENGLLAKEISSSLISNSKYADYETLYSYDSNGRLLSTRKYSLTDGVPSSEPVQWSETKYDDFGRVVELAQTCDSSERIYREKYKYSENGLEGRCDYGYYYAATDEYDPLFENGYILYMWDKVGNVTSKACYPSVGESTIERHEYKYDKDHCIISQTNYFNDAVSSSYKYVYFE